MTITKNALPNSYFSMKKIQKDLDDFLRRKLTNFDNQIMAFFDTSPIQRKQ